MAQKTLSGVDKKARVWFNWGVGPRWAASGRGDEMGEITKLRVAWEDGSVSTLVMNPSLEADSREQAQEMIDRCGDVILEQRNFSENVTLESKDDRWVKVNGGTISMSTDCAIDAGAWTAIEIIGWVAHLPGEGMWNQVRCHKCHKLTAEAMSDDGGTTWTCPGCAHD